MKRYFLVFFLIILSFSAAFAQRLPVVAILPVEITARISPEESVYITREIVAELSSWGTLNIVQDEAGAEYLVRGTLSRQGINYILTAETIEVSSKKKLNEAREQAATLRDISVFAFSVKAVENVPFPNYLVGTWQSTVNMPDGPVVCVIEFRSNRSIRVERYDTWEHRQNNMLRYEGYGTGSYSYAGYHSRRAMNVGSQQVQVDAIAGVYLRLEETLPEQTNVNQGRLGLEFNADRNAFNILSGSLPCGRNYDGPSVYPSTVIGFTQFTKIR
jgi:hypothetical protein